MSDIFDRIDPNTGEVGDIFDKLSSGKDDVQPQIEALKESETSTLGTFGREAGLAVLPSAAAGYSGSAAGAAVLPWALAAAPETFGVSLAVPVIAGLAVGMGGAWMAEQLQAWGLKGFMGEDNFNDFEKVRAESAIQHPYASFTGQLAGAVPSFGLNPRAAGKAVIDAKNLMRAANAAERSAYLAKEPKAIENLINVAVGSGTQTGMEAYNQIQSGDFQPVRLLGSIVAGAMMNENRLPGMGKLQWSHEAMDLLIGNTEVGKQMRFQRDANIQGVDDTVRTRVELDRMGDTVADTILAEKKRATGFSGMLQSWLGPDYARPGTLRRTLSQTDSALEWKRLNGVYDSAEAKVEGSGRDAIKKHVEQFALESFVPVEAEADVPAMKAKLTRVLPYGKPVSEIDPLTGEYVQGTVPIGDFPAARKVLEQAKQNEIKAEDLPDRTDPRYADQLHGLMKMAHIDDPARGADFYDLVRTAIKTNPSIKVGVVTDIVVRDKEEAFKNSDAPATAKEIAAMDASQTILRVIRGSNDADGWILISPKNLDPKNPNPISHADTFVHEYFERGMRDQASNDRMANPNRNINEDVPDELLPVDKEIHAAIETALKDNPNDPTLKNLKESNETTSGRRERMVRVMLNKIMQRSNTDNVVRNLNLSPESEEIMRQAGSRYMGKDVWDLATNKKAIVTEAGPAQREILRLMEQDTPDAWAEARGLINDNPDVVLSRKLRISSELDMRMPENRAKVVDVVAEQIAKKVTFSLEGLEEVIKKSGPKNFIPLITNLAAKNLPLPLTHRDMYGREYRPVLQKINGEWNLVDRLAGVRVPVEDYDITRTKEWAPILKETYQGAVRMNLDQMPERQRLWRKAPMMGNVASDLRQGSDLGDEHVVDLMSGRFRPGPDRPESSIAQVRSSVIRETEKTFGYGSEVETGAPGSEPVLSARDISEIEYLMGKQKLTEEEATRLDELENMLWPTPEAGTMRRYKDLEYKLGKEEVDEPSRLFAPEDQMAADVEAIEQEATKAGEDIITEAEKIETAMSGVKISGLYGRGMEADVVSGTRAADSVLVAESKPVTMEHLQPYADPIVADNLTSIVKIGDIAGQRLAEMVSNELYRQKHPVDLNKSVSGIKITDPTNINPKSPILDGPKRAGTSNIYDAAIAIVDLNPNSAEHAQFLPTLQTINATLTGRWPTRSPEVVRRPMKSLDPIKGKPQWTSEIIMDPIYREMTSLITEPGHRLGMWDRRAMAEDRGPQKALFTIDASVFSEPDAAKKLAPVIAKWMKRNRVENLGISAVGEVKGKKIVNPSWFDAAKDTLVKALMGEPGDVIEAGAVKPEPSAITKPTGEESPIVGQPPHSIPDTVYTGNMEGLDIWTITKPGMETTFSSMPGETAEQITARRDAKIAEYEALPPEQRETFQMEGLPGRIMQAVENRYPKLNDADMKRYGGMIGRALAGNDAARSTLLRTMLKKDRDAFANLLGPRVYPGETIVRPVVEFAGQKFYGPTHDIAIEGAHESGTSIPEANEQYRKFETSLGRTVSREEAARISGLQTKTESGKLHSTDILDQRDIAPSFQMDSLSEMVRRSDPMGGAGALHQAIIHAGRMVEVNVNKTADEARRIEEAAGVGSDPHLRTVAPTKGDILGNEMLKALGALKDDPNAKVIPATKKEIQPILDAWDASVAADKTGKLKTVKELLQMGKDSYDRNFREVNKYVADLSDEQYMRYIEDYVQHVYKSDTPVEEAAQKKLISDIKEQLGRTKERRIPTYGEAFEKYGLRPATTHLTDLMRQYARQVWSNAATKVVSSTAAILQRVDGAPIYLPRFSNVADEALHKGGFLDDKVVRQQIQQLADHINRERMDTRQGQIQQEIMDLQSKIEREQDQKFRSNLQKQVEDLRREEVNPKYERIDPKWDNALGIRGEYNRIFDIYNPKSRGYKEVKSNIPSVEVNWADPDSEKFVRMFNDKPFSNKLVDGLSEINQWSKYLSLNLSLFHPASLYESFLAAFGAAKAVTMSAKPWETIRSIRDAVKDIRAGKYDMDKWYAAGFKSKTNPDITMNVIDSRMSKMYEWAEKNGHQVLAGGIRKWAEYNSAWNNWLWNEMQPAMKLLTAEKLHMEMKDNFSKRGIQWDDKKLREDISGLMNNMYGGQEWTQYKWATPHTMQALHLGLFAPDWTISSLNASGLSSLPGINKLMDINLTPLQMNYVQKKYWPGMAVILLGIPNVMQGLQYMAFGKKEEGDQAFTWQNEPDRKTSIDMTPTLRKLGWVPIVGYEGGDTGKRRVYMRWGKQAWEVLDGWMTQPADTFLNKTSSTVRLAYEQITGTTTGGWKMPFTDNPGILGGMFSANDSVMDGRLASAAEKFVPMSILSTLKGQPSTFFAPTNRGTTMGTATTQMEHVLHAYADTSTWNTVKRQGYEEDLAKLGPEILVAAERNGVDSKEVLNRARVHVLAKYYQEFFKALNNDEPKKMEMNAEAILRLHGSIDGLYQSITRREKFSKKIGDPEKMKVAMAAFNTAQERFQAQVNQRKRGNRGSQE